MKRHIQLEPLLIQQIEINQWSFPVHTHDFYELIIIRRGSGFHTINGNRFPYAAGDVFLLGPSDYHSFSIIEKSHFCVLSFTEPYLTSLTTIKKGVWKLIKDYSLHTTQGFAGSLITNTTDQQHLNALVSIVLMEQKSHFQLSSPVMESLMGAILNLLERQLSPDHLKSMPSPTPSTDLVRGIVAYICQHIMEPEQLRIDQLAEVFHYSPGHLSAVFKQQVGESLQGYIIQYKLKLVEKRLRLSSMTISQIADEFGFTDISHLTKLFKRYYRHAPMVYRKDLLLTQGVSIPLTTNG
jgi:AraC family L-rhamnose operon regulatory protein RhaS